MTEIEEHWTRVRLGIYLLHRCIRAAQKGYEIMSGQTSMLLPPKMATELSVLAREGNADRYLGGDVAIFYRAPNQQITVYYDIDEGHIVKLSASKYLQETQTYCKARGTTP